LIQARRCVGLRLLAELRAGDKPRAGYMPDMCCAVPCHADRGRHSLLWVRDDVVVLRESDWAVNCLRAQLRLLPAWRAMTARRHWRIEIVQRLDEMLIHLAIAHDPG